MLTQHVCSISRKQKTGMKTLPVVIAKAVPCTFIPMSAQAALSNQYSVGFGWDIYFNRGTDVRSGDVLTWNGVKYVVGGSMPYIDFPGLDHVHVTAQTESARVQ